MAYLYVNSKGREVRSHSYSGGSLFRECAQKYKLARIDGWQDRELRASLEFGKAVESAVQFHHLNKLSGGPEEFARLWELQKNVDLKYTAAEGDWATLAKSGVEMLKLYHIRLSLFPFDLSVAPEFQIKYYKEMFPGTDMSGIEFVAYIDMRVCSKISLGDALIVDIKTSAKELPHESAMLGLDQQLRSYAWVTGVPDVAFLNFIKTGRSLERGSHVALLENVGKFTKGQHAVVIKYQDYEPAIPANPAKPKSKPKEEVPEETWIVENEDVIERMFKDCGRGQTNEEKLLRGTFIQQNATPIDKEFLTKQRIQFVNTHIGLSEQIEASRAIAQDVAQIVYSNQEDFWPLQGGIRFPNDKCVRCSMRGICLQNSQLRDTLVFRSDEEWDAPQAEEEN